MERGKARGDLTCVLKMLALALTGISNQSLDRASMLHSLSGSWPSNGAEKRSHWAYWREGAKYGLTNAPFFTERHLASGRQPSSKMS